MKINDLKSMTFLPEREYVINKKMNIRGFEVILLSLTSDNGKNALWLMYKNSCETDTIGPPAYGFKTGLSNREHRLNQLKNRMAFCGFSIKSIEIQGQTINFNSFRSILIYDGDIAGISKLQHFLKQGLVPEEWGATELKNIAIMECVQKENELMPHLDTSKDMPVAVQIGASTEEVFIQSPFRAKIGEYEKGTKISYHDPLLNKESFFYLNSVQAMDIRAQMQENLDKIENSELKETYIKQVDEFCSKTKNTVMVNYETEENIQLSFFTKGYLEASPVLSNSSMGIVLISQKGEEVGINGFRQRHDTLELQDEAFDKELELELFSRFVTIPEETVMG